MSVPTEQPGTGAQGEGTPVGTLGLCSVALAGPTAWFCDLSTRYFLVESGRAAGHEWWLGVIGGLYALLAAAAGWGSLRHLRRLRARGSGAELIAALGGGLALLSTLAILAALLPHLFLNPGER